MLVNKASIRMRKGEELKTPRHASAAALRDDRLPNSRQLEDTIQIINLPEPLKDKSKDKSILYKPILNID